MSELSQWRGEFAGAWPRDLEGIPCGSHSVDLWFADSPTDVEHAKALCRTCPVRRRCLAGALGRGEPWGVWGGEYFQHGVVVDRKRRPGRPRKRDAAA